LTTRELIGSDLDADLPAVAIITRTKDRAFMLRRAIDSLLSQDYDDWVHVVVNDGGDPEPVLALLESKAAQYRGRLIFLSNSGSLGMEAASNVGIRNSRSKYLLIHDDDDSLEASFLSNTVAYLEQTSVTSVAGVVTLSNLVYEQIQGERLVEQSRCLFRHLAGCVTIGQMAAENQFPPISFLYRRDVVEEIGLYDEGLPVLGDWDFNLRFLSRFDIAIIGERLANYYHRPVTSNPNYSNSVFAGKDKHALYDGLIRNAQIRRSQEEGLSAMALLMATARPAYQAPAGKRRYDFIYSVPLVRPLVRFMRDRGLLLRLTREV